MMPLAINLFDQEGDQQVLEYQRQKTSAQNKCKFVSFTFVAMTSVWFLASLITGNFVWRMTINLVLFYMTIVFLFSLWRIRSLIKKLNKDTSFKPNTALLNLNLVTFAMESIVFAVLGVLALYDDRSKKD